MARFKNSILGGLSGKIGPLVTYIRNGTQVVRSLPKPNDPKTEKQLAHRMKFKLVNQGLSPLNSAIKQGYRNKRDAYRTLVGKAYHEAIAGEYPDFRLDYGKIKIAEGKLQLPANIRMEKGDGEHTVVFSWDTQIVKPSDGSRNDDRVNIVYLSGDRRGTGQYHGSSKRVDGSATLKLPDGWKPEETLFWIFLTSYDQQHNSDSFFVKI
jgi:hypothetical protein